MEPSNAILGTNAVSAFDVVHSPKLSESSNMAPYFYPYPIPGPLTFSTLLLDRSGTYTSQLAEATVARTRLQGALKAAAEGQPGSSALAVLEVYHPYVLAIMACIDSDDLLYKGDPNFPWRPALTSYHLSTPTLSLPTVQAEHYFVLLVHTIALANYAHAILGGLPQFEAKGGQAPTITKEDEQKTSAGLTRAVDLLSHAAGIAEFAAENTTPQLDAGRTTTGGRLGKYRWPVETGGEAMTGLSMILLADAHVTAIRKLLLPILSHTLFAPPGPPLPSSHPSPSLLGKLYLHVSNLYSSASSLLVIPTNPQPSSSGSLLRRKKSDEVDSIDEDLVVELKRYLKKEAKLSKALAYKYLGIDEASKSLGSSLALLQESSKCLDDLKDSKLETKMKGLNFNKDKKKAEAVRNLRQGRIDREYYSVQAWLQANKKMNDTVNFERVPPFQEVVIPPGRPIFAAKKYALPKPKFKPSHVEAEEEKPEAEYAGHGNYF